MNYGYFDTKNNEYVITNPYTPSPWMNYIGNGGFGGIISATGGGLTFDTDPSNRRVTRYKFNNHPIDRPGRYIYIRDEETGDYHSATFQPVMKKGQFFECRHGLGYTKISGEYNGIASEVTFCVPINKRYELWQVKIANKSGRQRKLRIYSYCEFSWCDAKADMLCHWPSMSFRADFDGRKILVDTVAEQPTGTPLYDYIATSLPVIGYDCSLEKFVGNYRDEGNPQVLDSGICTNSDMYSDNCVGVLCSEIVLNAGEEKEFRYTLGAAISKELADKQVTDAFSLENAVENIKKLWSDYRENLKVKTPVEDMDLMLNVWHAYQAKTTFDWSRFISFYERGVDRGFGFRDSMQDVLGIMHADPEKAAERIKLLLSIQCSNGNAKSVYYPATKTAEGGGRSDDHLWSILSVCNYIRETGNIKFLDEQVDYYDGTCGSIADHLERGIEFTMQHLGKHGIPDMLLSDWDDSLSWINHGNLGAESVFVFFQLAHAAYELIKLYEFCGNNDGIQRMSKVYDYCRSKLDTVWDGEYFIRAFTPEGEKFCTKDDEFNNIHLIPQAWSVISHLADDRKANQAMDNVMKYLYTDMGIISHANASSGYDRKRKSYYLFPAGSRENGGIFFHSNTWPIIAFCMLKRPEDAFKIYEAMLPPRRNDISDVTLTEPYVYSQTMIAPPHKRAGACVNSWLTGTASWTYYCATQYILGVRPDYEGVIIDPCVPNNWDCFKIERRCRNGRLILNFKRGENKGLFINGEKIIGNIIKWDLFENGAVVEAEYID